MRYEHWWWEALVRLREDEMKHLKPLNFSTFEKAKAYLDAAYEKRLASIQARPDLNQVREGTCGANDDRSYNRRISWWVYASDGIIEHNDHFTTNPRYFCVELEE